MTIISRFNIKLASTNLGSNFLYTEEAISSRNVMITRVKRCFSQSNQVVLLPGISNFLLVPKPNHSK